MRENSDTRPALDRYTKAVLTVIAVLLGIVVLRPLTRPAPALAQSDYRYLYVEPGTTTLRRPNGLQQVEGKVMIDMRNGDIWGFPTLASTPYPIDTTKSQPAVSPPIYLGQFDFSKMTDAARNAR
jgi:hypothetical protein